MQDHSHNPFPPKPPLLRNHPECSSEQNSFALSETVSTFQTIYDASPTATFLWEVVVEEETDSGNPSFALACWNTACLQYLNSQFEKIVTEFQQSDPDAILHEELIRLYIPGSTSDLIRCFRAKSKVTVLQSCDSSTPHIHHLNSQLLRLTYHWISENQIAMFVETIQENSPLSEESRAALKTEEARFRTIFQASPVPMVLVNLDGTFFEANPTFCELIGYSADELHNKHFNEITHPDDALVSQEAFRKLVAGDFKPFSLEKRYHRKDGSEIQAIVWVGGIFDSRSNMQHTIAVFVDITKRKQIESALQFNQYAVERAREHFFWIKQDGQFFYVNQAACDALGYTREEMLRMSVPDIAPDLPHDTWPAFIANLDEVKSTVFESRHRRKDGSEFPIEISVGYIRYEGEYHVCGIARDITERKFHQEALKSAYDDLERRVEERTQELTQLNQRLEAEILVREQAQKELTREQQFLRNMLDLQERERRLMMCEIHDGLLQEVLGANLIIGNSLKHSAKHPTSINASILNQLDEARALLSRSLKEGRRLINDVRPFVLDEEGLVEAIEYLASYEQTQGKIHLNFQHQLLDSRLEPLLEGALFRMIQETLHNVKQHSQATEVEIHLKQTKKSIDLSISDNGIGFDLKSITKDNFGIRSIKERARLFGGTAKIESVRGKGTTVIIQVPT